MTISSPSEGRERLRAQHQVRPLRPEEEGTAIEHLPAGVYGFTYSPGREAVPVFDKENYHSFEIHKAADGSAYIIGFVTVEEGAKIEVMEEGAAIRLFPEQWESAQTIVSVPLSKIVAPKRSLPREGGNPFPFTIA